MAFVRKRIPERSVVVEDEMPDWRATIKRHVKGLTSYAFPKNDPALEPYVIAILWDRSAHKIKNGGPYYVGTLLDHALPAGETRISTVNESNLDHFCLQLQRLENMIFDEMHDDLFDLEGY